MKKLDKFVGYLKIPLQEMSLNNVILYAIIIYLFGVALRMILLYQASQIGPIWLNGEPMAIWTPDAGRYGFYAKEILSGHILPFRDDYLLGYLVAFVSKDFHLSLAWTMVLLPAFIAPLIVIPMAMTGRALRLNAIALLGALLAVSDIFFYSRSTIGYMDTDGVNLFLIMMSMAWIILGFKSKNLIYLLFAALTLIFFDWWYHSATVIILLVIAISFVYVLIRGLKDRALLAGFLILSVSVAPVSIMTKTAVAVTTYVILTYFLHRYKKIDHRYFLALIIVGVLIVLVTVDPHYYIGRAMTYLSSPEYKSFSAGGITYYSINDLKNIAEVTGVDLWSAFAPLFVSIVYVIVATVAYVLFVVAYPLIGITAPLLILGYMSSFAGSRFTMFASPVLALGAVYLLYLFREVLRKRFGNGRYIHRSPYYGVTLVMLLMIYNIFAYNTNVGRGMQFYSWDKALLDKFSKNLSDKDTIVSWWDYGWPLWYYTGHNITLTDNGKHGGIDTHFTGQILLSDDPYFTANGARYISRYKASPSIDEAQPTLPLLAKDHNLSKLFDSFHQKHKISLPGEKGNVYILLHQNMLSYYGVIRDYAYWDITKKIHKKMPRYRSTPVIRPFSHNYSLLEGYGFILDSKDGMVLDGDGNKTALNTLMLATQNNTRKESFTFHNNANMNMISAKGLLLWLDKKAYNSFYIQAMLLDVYDHNLFEKVGETGRIKIFRVKKPNE